MQKIKRPRKCVGIMGGTFDPIHLGHLRAAEEIAEHFTLDQVLFIPAANPPHKSPHPMVGFKHRLNMLCFALKDRPGFVASDLEERLSSPSFTINTLKTVQQSFDDETKLFFMVGLDSFMTIDSWYRYAEVLQTSSFVVFGRAGIQDTFDSMFDMLKRIMGSSVKWHSEASYFSSPNMCNIYFMPGGRLEISSSDLRQRLETGASVRYLVPEAVRIYIEKHGLYRPGSIQ